MHKQMLLQTLRERFPSLSAKTIEAMTDAAFETIIDSLVRGRTVEIRRFGTFFTRTLSRRMLRNPANGEAMEVPARRLPRFKASRRLRDMVDRGGG